MGRSSVKCCRVVNSTVWKVGLSCGVLSCPKRMLLTERRDGGLTST
jgi:hypothetical protein